MNVYFSFPKDLGHLVTKLRQRDNLQTNLFDFVPHLTVRVPGSYRVLSSYVYFSVNIFSYVSFFLSDLKEIVRWWYFRPGLSCKVVVFI